MNLIQNAFASEQLLARGRARAPAARTIVELGRGHGGAAKPRRRGSERARMRAQLCCAAVCFQARAAPSECSENQRHRLSRRSACPRAPVPAMLRVQRRWAGSRSGHVYLPGLGDSPPAAAAVPLHAQNTAGNSLRVSCSPRSSDDEGAACLRSTGASGRHHDAPPSCGWDEELAGLKQEMEYDVHRILTSGRDRKSCRRALFDGSRRGLHSPKND